MVHARTAVAVLSLVLTATGLAPVAVAEPVGAGPSVGAAVCQVPPNPVAAQELSPENVDGAGDPEVWSAHVAYVERALAATPTTEELYTQHGVWVADRVRQQNAVLDEYWQLHHGDSVPREGRAIIAGGVPGAGKTTVLTQQPAMDIQRYFNINPDDVKEVMAARSMIPVIAALSPMEASADAHEEASMLAKQLAERAYRQRMNVVWDITMSTEASVRDRMDAMREAGYSQIDGVFVDTPLVTARSRVMQRWRRDQEKYWSGEGLGGRYVPSAFIDLSKPDKPGFSSRNQQIFEEFRDQFSSTVEYDSSGPEPIVRCVTGPRWS